MSDIDGVNLPDQISWSNIASEQLQADAPSDQDAVAQKQAAANYLRLRFHNDPNTTFAHAICEA